jgi:translocation and assembly module TamA
MYRHTSHRLFFMTLVFFSVLAPRATPAADPQPYVVNLVKTSDAALDQALDQSSTLVTLLKTAPVGPFALVARAQDDVGRFQDALRSFGYYKASVTLSIAGHKLDDPGLLQLLDGTDSATTVPVMVGFELGPLFHLRNVTLRGDVPPDVRAKFGLAPGQTALAAPVLAVQNRLLSALQDEGYAFAKVDAPEVLLIADENALDVTYTAVPGARVDLGPIGLDGLKRVNAGYVRQRLLLKPGQLYDPVKIEAARQDLAALGVFDSVRVRAAEKLDAEGQLPLTLTFTERPRHVVSVTGAFSTDQGGSVTTSWSDRNLFGNAENLTLSAAATGLGGSSTTQPGYNLSATFVKPDWLARDQSLTINTTALKESLEAYNRTAFIIGGSVARKVTPDFTLSLGLTATQEEVEQENVKRSYVLAGVPIGAKFDNTGSLFDPTHGYRGQATITPTESLGGTSGSATFVVTQLSGSAYLDFGSKGRSVLAFRALVGSAGGATQFELPPDQRFYGGGSASIRGYKYQYVGPQFPDEHPQGGTSIDAATIEFRQRFYESYGAVLFADAGQVGTGATPFQGPLRVGVGMGARYYTPIGPIRLDFAVPLSRIPGGDSFEIYIGIGQAF